MSEYRNDMSPWSPSLLTRTNNKPLLWLRENGETLCHLRPYSSKLSRPEVELPELKAGLIQWRPKVKDKQRSRHLPLPVHYFRARLRSTPRGCIGTSGNGLQIVDLPTELKESSRQLNQNCFVQLRIAQHDLWISLSHGVRQGVL